MAENISGLPTLAAIRHFCRTETEVNEPKLRPGFFAYTLREGNAVTVRCDWFEIEYQPGTGAARIPESALDKLWHLSVSEAFDGEPTTFELDGFRYVIVPGHYVSVEEEDSLERVKLWVDPPV